MKKLLLSIILFIIAIPVISAMTASEILDKAASKINSAKSITAEYTISAASNKEKGTLILASGKFTLTSGSLRSWFDGLTLWTYSPAMGEVNITNPTAEEIADINPFAVINAHKQNYRSALLSSEKNIYKIDLTPVKKGMAFSKATVILDAATYLPKEIILTMPDKSKIEIAIDKVTAGNMINSRTFVFDPSYAPDAEIVDLR